MHKFPIVNYSTFDQLPFGELDQQKFLIYIMDRNWQYLFVNAFACNVLKKKPEELIGKNMWEVYGELEGDPSFVQLKKNAEENKVSNINTVSPVTGQRINIASYPLTDCYYFAVSILPQKDALMNELREELLKLKAKNG